MKYTELMSTVTAKPADREKMEAKAYCVHPTDKIPCGLDTGREIQIRCKDTVAMAKVDPRCGNTRRDPDWDRDPHTPVIHEHTRTPKLDELKQGLKAHLKEVKNS